MHSAYSCPKRMMKKTMRRRKIASHCLSKHPTIGNMTSFCLLDSFCGLKTSTALLHVWFWGSVAWHVFARDITTLVWHNKPAHLWVSNFLTQYYSFPIIKKTRKDLHVEQIRDWLLHKHESLGGAACKCRHLHDEKTQCIKSLYLKGQSSSSYTKM